MRKIMPNYEIANQINQNIYSNASLTSKKIEKKIYITIIDIKKYVELCRRIKSNWNKTKTIDCFNCACQGGNALNSDW